MTEVENDERRYIHGALLLTVRNASDLGSVRSLIDQGRQLLVMIPSNMARAEYDTLADELMGVVAGAEAELAAVQVGSVRPRGWRRWLARLSATRTFIVTPRTLADPSVAVLWAPEPDADVKRLVVGEIRRLKAGFRREG